MSDESPVPQPSRAFVAGLGALLVGVAAIWFFGSGLSGPSWAGCLWPALFGVIDGVWLSHDRARMVLGVPRGRSLRFDTGVLVLLVVGATVSAVLEQLLANAVFPRAPLWLRVAYVAVLVTFGVSRLRPTVLWVSSSCEASADDSGR